MTNFEKIKSMTEEEFANWLCKCVIPEDTDEDMVLCGYGEFTYEKDIVKMLKENCGEDAERAAVEENKGADSGRNG